jgi:hypothetical protein
MSATMLASTTALALMGAVSLAGPLFMRDCRAVVLIVLSSLDRVERP